MGRKPKAPPPSAPFGADLGDLLTYDAGPYRARLALHPTDDPGFVTAFTAVIGGSLHPDHGGSWERGRKASAFLVDREAPGSAKAKNELRERLQAIPQEHRGIVDDWGATAGLQRHCCSVLLTTGEIAFYDDVITRVKAASADDMLDAIIKGFDLEDQTPEVTEIPDGAVLAVGTPGGGVATQPPSAPPPGESLAAPKRTDVVMEDGVTVPAGYCDGVPQNMTVQETKDFVLGFVHRVYIAEVLRQKSRTSLLKWLDSKAKGFKIPDEWRVSEGDEET